MKTSKKNVKVLRLGILSFVVGLVLRINARSIVWPREYSYSGPRENTLWAIRETALSEISTAIYIFGLLIFLLLIAKHIFIDEVIANEE